MFILIRYIKFNLIIVATQNVGIHKCTNRSIVFESRLLAIAQLMQKFLEV